MEKRHFSHPHYLNLHQIAHGTEIRCSGCKQSADTGSSKSVYSCWQCSFFLHEQCFLATRALNHPLHPSHPLTLTPYPTHPSGSFLCNSCNQSGDGFSYTCAHCDFDLHVHCAYQTQTNKTHDSTYPSFTHNFNNQQYPNHDHPHLYPPPTNVANHPLIPNQPPNFSPQYNSYPQTHVTYPPTPNFGAQFSYGHQSGTYEHPNPGTHVPNPSFPNLNTQLCPQPTHQDQNPQIPIPNHFSPFQPPNQNQCPPPYPNQPSAPIFNPQTNHPIPAPIFNPQPNHPNPIPNTLLGSGGAPESDPPNSAPNFENLQKLQGVKHFTHQHPLLFSAIRAEEGEICSGCEEKLSGSAYICTKSDCNFKLHNSCFGLPREIQHDSHPKHRLTLLASPPYAEGNGFACNACLGSGNAFTYHCDSCNFDLHSDCAFLSETMKRADHEHPLNLFYIFPFRKEKKEDPDPVFVCDVCSGVVDPRCWFYYCQQCDFGTHLACITAEGFVPQEEEEDEEEEEDQSSAEAHSELASVLQAQLQMQRLKLELEMSQQTAQAIANLGQSVLNIVS